MTLPDDKAERAGGPQYHAALARIAELEAECDACKRAAFQAQEMAKEQMARADAMKERCAQVVDQCNREGPYNAIGAASRIRALKETP
jgi:hypothetical protein